MAVEDDGPHSNENNQNGDVLSPEVEWADSCLIKDLTDSSWESLKDALLEALDSRSESSFSEIRDTSNEADLEVIRTREETGSSRNWDKAVDSNDATTIQGGEKAENDHTDDDADTSWSGINMAKVFRPTYNESLRDIATFELDLDSGFPVSVIDQPPEDIFKVWDLDTPDEEDELIRQLNKALAESSVEPSSPVSDDSNVWKEWKEVDDLISGLADLSLIEDSV